MNEDRSAIIVMDGAEYPLLLTTRATKEISKRYGGIDKLGEKLLKAENFELALDEVVWLIVLLANQTIQIHNLRNKDDKRELLTEEEIELLTVPSDIAAYKDGIMEAMLKGTKRNVESEDSSKNV